MTEHRYSKLIGELKQKKKVLTYFIYKCQVVIWKKKYWTFNNIFFLQKFANSLKAPF